MTELWPKKFTLADFGIEGRKHNFFDDYFGLVMENHSFNSMYVGVPPRCVQPDEWVYIVRGVRVLAVQYKNHEEGFAAGQDARGRQYMFRNYYFTLKEAEDEAEARWKKMRNTRA